MEKIFTWNNIIIAIIFLGIGLYLGSKSEGSVPQEIEKYKMYVDTLVVTKNNLKYKYFESKKDVVKWDTVYVAGKDTICDSLVNAQRIALENCDSLQNIQEKIIVKYDTIFNLQNVYIKEKSGRKIKLGGFVGGGINPDLVVRPTAGFGIIF